ncbi:hypothetical protein IWW50_004089 [Coemansia erecta]|nr:hypothetical protein GGF43_003462 [Coemansia sp. RSA 2618]KAJ2822726.1 hypothetical protein IWW50_004089 [Coemansia erecta]
MWYFGSRARNAPGFNATRDTVPLVFWFSGGPGCSSQIANWQENGPCVYAPTVPFTAGLPDKLRKKLPHAVRRNPLAWNAVADVVYIDQPVGTGFSHGPMPGSTEEAADTAWRAMQGVYAMLSERARTSNEATIDDVYIFGESYAGRYVPVFSEYVLHMNDQIAESEDLRTRGFQNLPLSGIGVGNGLFDTRLQAPSAYTMGCASTYAPLFSDAHCSELQDSMLPACATALNECQTETTNSTAGMRTDTCPQLQPEAWRSSAQCKAADAACNGALSWTTSVSTYDVRPGARMVPDDYVSYLRSREFTDAVGVDPGIKYEECSDDVFDKFSASGDAMSRSAISSLEFILGRRVPVMLYSGDADFICNWFGTVAVAKALNWSGRGELAAAPVTDWTWPAESGKHIPGGQFVSAANMTFLRVYEAGHEVPYYQPQAALYMLAQFLDRHTLY